MADFTIGQDDRKPDLTATLLENGEAMNLTGASGVTLYALKADGTTGFTGACTIVSAALGKVKYSFAAGNTANPGDYRLAFVIDWGSSVYQTVPTARSALLRVVASLTADT